MSRKRKKNYNSDILTSTVKRRKLIAADYWVIAISIIVVLGIIYGLIQANIPKNYYVTDIKLAQCTVQEKSFENTKYYIRVKPDQPQDFTLAEENSWVEVQNQFFDKVMISDKVAARIVNTDVYRKKFWGLFSNQGQVFYENVWNIDDVYNSLTEAQNANPSKKFTQKATIQKKKITTKGDHFFVINIEQKTMPVMVEKGIYDKYKVNDSISCEFESIGDFTKYIKLVE